LAEAADIETFGQSRSKTRDLREMTLGELEQVAVEAGEAPYRARQVMRWLWVHDASSADAMREVPARLRLYLKQHFSISRLAASYVARAADGTRKLLLRLEDCAEIESVIIPADDRTTLCISSQAGCAMACQFCATARMGLHRNLAASEILGQIIAAKSELTRAQQRDRHPEGTEGTTRSEESAPPHDRNPERNALAGTQWSRANESAECVLEKGVSRNDSAAVKRNERLTNYVFMGMGEPLANYARLSRALTIMTAEWGLAISPRRITVSTVGLVPMMERLLADFPVNLAVSLHATSDQLRDRLAPINRRYPLTGLLDACRRLPLNRRSRITFEYVMLSGVNDSPEDACRLLEMLAPLKSKVNLIFFNPFAGSPFQPTPRAQVEDFQAILLRGSLTATVRESRGQDIAAACGQLFAERRTRIEN
jgi:23S rRNA (adenine2503-C2)-methyltransferase